MFFLPACISKSRASMKRKRITGCNSLSTKRLRSKIGNEYYNQDDYIIVADIKNGYKYVIHAEAGLPDAAIYFLPFCFFNAFCG
jgi:hypothetical protein